MTQDTYAARMAPQAEMPERPSRTEMSLLRDLVTVLKPHARGLRKWSVMRAMRLRQSREISLKFEQDVERIFRRYCVGEATLMACTAETAPFFRPRDTAGEVWALHPDRAEALLGAAG